MEVKAVQEVPGGAGCGVLLARGLHSSSLTALPDTPCLPWRCMKHFCRPQARARCQGHQ